MIPYIQEHSLYIQCLFFLALSIVTTVLFALYKPFPVYCIILLQFSSIAGILFLLFYREIGVFGNAVSSFFRRSYSESREDNEPSGFVLFCNKLLGYLLIALQLSFLFVSHL